MFTTKTSPGVFSTWPDAGRDKTDNSWSTARGYLLASNACIIYTQGVDNTAEKICGKIG